MGLDQFVTATKENTKSQEIMYWRKHNRLEGWMEALWRAKGGEGEFNCQDVELTLADLDDLERAIINMELPETGGFFFGSDSYNDFYEPAEDLPFIKEARQRIADGWTLFYHSWW
jgi:hypothetical protein